MKIELNLPFGKKVPTEHLGRASLDYGVFDK